MKIRNIGLGVVALSILASQGAAARPLPQSPKIDAYVQKQINSGFDDLNVTILVVLKEQADLGGVDGLPKKKKGRFVYDQLRNTALSTQGPLVDFLKSKNVKFRQYYIENMIAVEDPTTELVQELSARPDVARIMGNPAVKLKMPALPMLAMMASSAGPEENLVRIGATKVWESFHDKGEGIVVASQDTGVKWDHPALKNQYRGVSGKGVDHNYNWHDAIHRPINEASPPNLCGYDVQAPCDDDGHGTHTVGTMVGDDSSGNQIGVAPKAKWVACRNMEGGVGTVASYLECFEFFLAPYPLNGDAMKEGDPKRAPHIINNSWGCTRSEGCVGDEILPALAAMKKAGIFVVAAAGNEGPGCSTIMAPPAWHTGLNLSVGAFNHRDDQITFFSSRGPSAIDGGTGPNLSAPGMYIRSSVPEGYTLMSGTSMAGPHAAGVAALLWSFNKKLIGDIDTSVSILEKTSEPKTTHESCGGKSGSEIPNNTYGHGLINAYKAVCSQSENCA